MIHQIKSRFDRLCQTPSSINEHLDRLRELASHCETIAEFGVDIGQSTTAFLLGQPKTLYSLDLVCRPELDELIAAASSSMGLVGGSFTASIARTNWIFRLADSRTWQLPEPVDLLFIDSAHSYAQLSAELARHGEQAKMIVLHDTVTFGDTGEDGKAPGLMPALLDWLTRHPAWSIQAHWPNNNGLTLVERRS